MEVELGLRNISFVSQAPIAIFYKGQLPQKRYIADFWCYQQLIVEINVMEKLTSREVSQLFNDMHATRTRVGLLTNFGASSHLEWQRFVL